MCDLPRAPGTDPPAQDPHPSRATPDLCGGPGWAVIYAMMLAYPH